MAFRTKAANCDGKRQREMYECAKFKRVRWRGVYRASIVPVSADHQSSLDRLARW